MMADLISRATAKFQACNWSVKPNAVIYDGIKEVIKSQLDMAPTIDAIPVEWLECKRKEALKEGMRPDEVEAIEMVMWMWQKEQEEKRPEGNPDCMGLGYEPCETCDSCCPYR